MRFCLFRLGCRGRGRGRMNERIYQQCHRHRCCLLVPAPASLDASAMLLQLPGEAGSVPFCVPSGLEPGVPCRLPLTAEVWEAAAAGLGARAAAVLMAAQPAEPEAGVTIAAEASAGEAVEEMGEFRKVHLAELAEKKRQRYAAIDLRTAV